MTEFRLEQINGWGSTTLVEVDSLEEIKKFCEQKSGGQKLTDGGEAD